MRTSEQIQISVEDTNREIEFVEIGLRKIGDLRLPQEIKNEFINRLETEKNWLEEIREDDEKTLIFLDDKVNVQLEELKIKNGELE